VAHEINNPLAIISVKAQLMLEQISEGPIDLTKARKDLSTITATAERIAVTVRGLRMFSRSSENDSQTPNFLHQIVNQTLDLCAERFKLGGVEIKKDLGDDIQFSCRPAQISQVLLNLVSNAFDAVQSSEEKWVRVLARVSGETVRIEVSDGGPGIPQTVRERIMEPFFTTKPPGHGTGLGLSISRGILEAHGGTLSLEPAEAHTTFRLELPILVKASKPRAA
jgi:signal transduction histidine kinase